MKKRQVNQEKIIEILRKRVKHNNRASSKVLDFMYLMAEITLSHLIHIPYEHFIFFTKNV
nr:hypothetical protein [Mucilaginibacter sp. X5P1]